MPGQYIKVAFTKRSVATFAEEQSKASWRSVWFQLIFFALVFAILVSVDELITNTAASVLDLIGIIIFFIVVIPIAFFIITGIYYLIARAFGGQGTFLAQSYTTLLFIVPVVILVALLVTLIDLIPAIGSVAHLGVDVYIIVLSIRMIMGVHRLSAGKATAVILIPLAVIIFIVILIAFAVVAVRPA